MWVKSLADLAGVDDNQLQIIMMGKVGIAAPEECENALAEIFCYEFKAACRMFDHKADAEADTE